MAQTISPRFQAQLSNNLRWARGYLWNLENNAYMYDNDLLISFKITTNLQKDANIYGNTICKYAEVKAKNPGNLIRPAIGDRIHLYTGLTLDYTLPTEDVEYLDQGVFTLYEVKYDEDNESMTTYNYDDMVKFNVKYYENGNVYPMTLANFAASLCARVGLELGNTVFPNSTLLIPQPNVAANEYTCRDILGWVAELASGNAMIGRDNKVYIKTYSDAASVFTITPNIYIKLKRSPVFGPINSVAMIREALGDTVHYPAVLPLNPISYKIIDNMVAYDQRESIIQTIYNEVLGMTYTPFELDWRATGHLDFMDKITITDTNDVSFNTYVMNKTIYFDGTLREELSAVAYTAAASAIANSGTSKTKGKLTEAKVNKIDGEISLIASEVNDLTGRVSDTEAAIIINANNISLKASQASFDDLTGRVSDTEASLIIQADAIATKVSSTDYNGNEIASRINQTATTISIEASKININGVVSANTYFKINANGSMEAKAGKIADWNITTDRIYAGTSSDYVGMSPGILSSSEYYAFWAGNSTPASAPFGVTRAGKLYATSGEVGAFTLGSDRLYAGASTTYVGIAPNVSGYSFWAGNPNPASAPFSVTRSGAVKMINAELDGVALTTGGIGNAYGHVFFTSSQSQLKLSSGSIIATTLDWRLYATNFTSASTSNTLGTSAYRWGGMWTTGGYVTGSDRRLKDNIKPIENGVDLILSIRPVEYNMADGQRKHYGFIAQEVQEVMANTVGDFGGFIDPTIKPDWDVNDPVENDKPHYLSLRYDEFIAPMVQTIQALHKRISALEEK